MAIVASTIVGGVVRATWDDTTQLYTEFAPDGTTQTLQRAYTQVELDAKAERAPGVTNRANYAALQAQFSQRIADLLVDITTLNTLAGTAAATINAAPATYIKQLGAGLKRTDQAVIGLARIIGQQLSTSDVGT